MTRSPLAYPLNRSADTDIGGAADLQTDIMRFMAILSLCLVAIFALVQSIPLTPVEPVPSEPEPIARPVEHQPDPIETAPDAPAEQRIEPAPAVVEEKLVLTRPAWKPKYAPTAVEQARSVVVTRDDPAPSPQPATTPAPPVENQEQGFTLRFASDAALTRAVAAHHVGLYALGSNSAKRMTVSDSHISFWDASTPNTFHEMETTTVPAAVVDALARTGVATDTVGWAVTLPGKMKNQLDSLMREHAGGSLIINAAGEVHWEEQ